MVVATYYGGNRETYFVRNCDSKYDYTKWYACIAEIKEDFRRFIDYKLVDIENSENLVKELKNVSDNLLNECPLGLNYLENFK